jgi:predicted alpha/beta hydrolase
MREWLVVAVLYALNLALFRWLGGFGSAGRAFRDWGRWSTTVRRDESSASSS